MTTSPPSATAGSILYMPLPAVHTSAYIGGITDNTVFIGRSSHTMWRCDDSSDAFCHASRASPNHKPAVPSDVTTSAKHEAGTLTIAAARSITARTGV